MYVKTNELGPVEGGVRRKILFVHPPMRTTVKFTLGVVEAPGVLVIGVLILDDGLDPGRELEGVLLGDMSMSSVCRESKIQSYMLLHVSMAVQLNGSQCWD